MPSDTCERRPRLSVPGSEIFPSFFLRGWELNSCPGRINQARTDAGVFDRLLSGPRPGTSEIRVSSRAGVCPCAKKLISETLLG